MLGSQRGSGLPWRPPNAALRKVQSVPNIAEEELSFWRQFLQSSLALGETQPLLKKREISLQRKYGNYRDAQMAKNLIWLPQQAFPKRIILVWAASFHLLKNPKTVKYATVNKEGKVEKTTPIYEETTMGHEALKVLGRESYSPTLTAAEGEFKLPWWDKGRELKPLVAGSLEDYFDKANFKYAFLDLKKRGNDGKWLEERMIARPLGHGDLEADWTQVIDGFVFTRRMYGSELAPAAVKLEPKGK